MAASRWLDETEARAWRGYLRMNETLRAQLERRLGADGLSYTDYQVLVQLSETPSMRLRMTDLASRLLWSRSRLSHQITRMSRRGLVSRQGCESDARVSYAALSEAGLQAITSAAPGHVAAVREYFIDRLDREQLAALIEISGRVVEHLPDS